MASFVETATLRVKDEASGPIKAINDALKELQKTAKGLKDMKAGAAGDKSAAKATAVAAKETKAAQAGVAKEAKAAAAAAKAETKERNAQARVAAQAARTAEKERNAQARAIAWKARLEAKERAAQAQAAAQQARQEERSRAAQARAVAQQVKAAERVKATQARVAAQQARADERAQAAQERAAVRAQAIQARQVAATGAAAQAQVQAAQNATARIGAATSAAMRQGMTAAAVQQAQQAVARTLGVRPTSVPSAGRRGPAVGPWGPVPAAAPDEEGPPHRTSAGMMRSIFGGAGRFGGGMVAGLTGAGYFSAAEFGRLVGQAMRAGVQQSDIGDVSLALQQLDRVFGKWEGKPGEPGFRLVEPDKEAPNRARQMIKELGEERGGIGLLNVGQRTQLFAESFGTTKDLAAAKGMTRALEDMIGMLSLYGKSFNDAKEDAYNFAKGLESMGRLTDKATGKFDPQKLTDSVGMLMQLAPGIGKEFSGSFFRNMTKYLAPVKGTITDPALMKLMFMGEEIGTRAAVGYSSAVKQLLSRQAGEGATLQAMREKEKIGLATATAWNKRGEAIKFSMPAADRQMILEDLPKYVNERLIPQLKKEAAEKKTTFDPTDPVQAIEAGLRFGSSRISQETIAMLILRAQEMERDYQQALLRTKDPREIDRVIRDTPTFAAMALKNSFESASGEALKSIFPVAAPLMRGATKLFSDAAENMKSGDATKWALGIGQLGTAAIPFGLAAGFQGLMHPQTAAMSSAGIALTGAAAALNTSAAALGTAAVALGASAGANILEKLPGLGPLLKAGAAGLAILGMPTGGVGPTVPGGGGDITKDTYFDAYQKTRDQELRAKIEKYWDAQRKYGDALTRVADLNKFLESKSKFDLPVSLLTGPEAARIKNLPPGKPIPEDIVKRLTAQRDMLQKTLQLLASIFEAAKIPGLEEPGGGLPGGLPGIKPLIEPPKPKPLPSKDPDYLRRRREEEGLEPKPIEIKPPPTPIPVVPVAPPTPEKPDLGVPAGVPDWFKRYFPEGAPPAAPAPGAPTREIAPGGAGLTGQEVPQLVEAIRTAGTSFSEAFSTGRDTLAGGGAQFASNAVPGLAGAGGQFGSSAAGAINASGLGATMGSAARAQLEGITINVKVDTAGLNTGKQPTEAG